MSGDNDTAARYRQRAEEVRLIAQNMKDEQAREILQGVAEDYERMARQRDYTAEIDRRLAAQKRDDSH